MAQILNLGFKMLSTDDSRCHYSRAKNPTSAATNYQNLRPYATTVVSLPVASWRWDCVVFHLCWVSQVITLIWKSWSLWKTLIWSPSDWFENSSMTRKCPRTSSHNGLYFFAGLTTGICSEQAVKHTLRRLALIWLGGWLLCNPTRGKVVNELMS